MSSESLRTMARQIESRLARQRISQTKFAAMAHVSKQYVGSVFHGRDVKTNLDEWARLLGARFVITLVDIDAVGEVEEDDNVGQAISIALYVLRRLTAEQAHDAEVAEALAQLDAADRRRRERGADADAAAE